MKTLKKFCKWQVSCKDDLDIDGNQLAWTCTADLVDGRAFNCIYKSARERITAETIPYAYPCASFSPIGKLSREDTNG